MTFEVRDVDVEKFKNEVLNKVVDKLGNNVFTVREKPVKTISIPVGDACKLCNSALSVPYYYNPF